MSVLGIREDFSQTRGATSECISALPIYKFKVKRDTNADGGDFNPGGSEGGVLAAGTEKERFLSGEDAVSLIPALLHPFQFWSYSTLLLNFDL